MKEINNTVALVLIIHDNVHAGTYDTCVIWVVYSILKMEGIIIPKDALLRYKATI